MTEIKDKSEKIKQAKAWLAKAFDSQKERCESFGTLKRKAYHGNKIDMCGMNGRQCVAGNCLVYGKIAFEQHKMRKQLKYHQEKKNG